MSDFIGWWKSIYRVVALWEMEHLLVIDQLIPDFQRMTSSSMRFDNKVATEAAARMRAAGEQASEDKAAEVS